MNIERLLQVNLHPLRAGAKLNPSLFFRETHNITAKPGETIPINLPGTARITVETFPGSDKVNVDGIHTDIDSDGSGSITVSRGNRFVSFWWAGRFWSDSIGFGS